MIDTVTLYKQGRNLEDFNLNFKEFQNRNTSRKTGQINYITDNFHFSDKEKRNIYCKYDLNRNFILVSFSIPKLLHGNSLETVKITDKDKVINELNRRLKGYLEADFENMEMSRLDVTQNIKLDREISYCIPALKQAYDVTNGRYNVSNIENETITIKNKSRVTRIYDKVKESIANKELTKKEALNYGNILRMETEHKKRQHIKTSFPAYYSKGKILTYSDLFTEQKFNDFKQFQLKTFNTFFLNNGKYELFLEDVAMIELLLQHNKRSVAKNFIVKKYVDSETYNEDSFKDIIRPFYTRQGMNKVIKELRHIKKIGKSKVSDIIQEIRLKLVA
jgi:hypothetical protein